jgi:hypothetical protein
MTSKKGYLGFKLMAAALVVLLKASGWPVLAAPGGELTGVVRAADGRSPLVGAVVHVADRASGTVYSSKPAGADGSFQVGGLPDANYEVGIETQDGLFLVYVPLAVKQANSQRIELVVTDSPEARDLVRAGRRADTAGVWQNPLTSALIVVGGAIAIGAIVNAADDDDETDATNF